MTTILSLSGEDYPLLIGGAVAIAGLLVHNMDATAAGLAIALGGKAILHSNPPDVKQP